MSDPFKTADQSINGVVRPRTTRREAADVHGQATALITAHLTRHLTGTGPGTILTQYLKDAEEPVKAAAFIALIATGWTSATLLNLAGGDTDTALQILTNMTINREKEI